MGPRPEKSGEETTSLGMSSLPTSDGLNHPARPSGQSPEIGNPAGPAHSVSASVCPIKPSDPDSIAPNAVKASKATTEFQIPSEKKEPLPLQDLSGPASPADWGPAVPWQNSPEEATAADDLEASPAERSTQSLNSPLHPTQEVSVTATRMQELQRFLGEKGWHPECQTLSQVEPGDGQHEVVQQKVPHDREHLCNKGDLELLGERQQNQPKSVDMEAAMKGDRLRQDVDLPAVQNSLPSGCSDCSSSETLMEVDVVEQPPLPVLSSAGDQNAIVKSVSASDLTLDNPLMEMETSKCNPSPETLSSSISAQNSQRLESSVEMSGTSEDCGDCSPAGGLCGRCQPSVESAEESCSSITAALKELQGLLVTSSKPASEIPSQEVSCQSETVTEGRTSLGVLSEGWIQSEQCSQVSFHQATSVSVKTERLVDTSAGTRMGDVEDANFRGPADGLVTDSEGAPQSTEPVNESSSVILASAKTSNQLHCTSGEEISPKLLAGEEALKQTSEQTKSLSSEFMLVKDLGQDTQDPVAGGPETREAVCPGAAGPLVELEPPTSSPSSGPSLLPPVLFPAADIDRILHAGFTLQEALGALQQVGGNADLALLILLAKNIVVPT